MSFFGRVRGGVTFHMEDEEGISIQFAVGYHGEDVSLLVEAFWKEYDGSADFLVIPVIAYGKAPRGELCTPQSLRAALDTANPNPDSRQGQMWGIACRQHGIDWPPKSSVKPALKAAATA